MFKCPLMHSKDFTQSILRVAKQWFQNEGKSHLVVDALWCTQVIKHMCLSIIGNITKCVNELGIERSKEDWEKISLWDAQWVEEKQRSKRAKEIDTQLALSKHQTKMLDKFARSVDIDKPATSAMVVAGHGQLARSR